jgi:DNA-directed RNA polymerase I, II, and III subunit RPABC5
VNASKLKKETRIYPGVSEEMIIPVRCMNCGKLLADKWDYYQSRLRQLKGSGYAEPTCFDGKNVMETPEAQVYKELDLTRYCCKKTLLTHVDLIEKI